VLNQFLQMYIKLFFVLTPFLVLSTFLAWTASQSQAAKRQVAWRTLIAIAVICTVLFLVGNHLFSLIGITLDAFRVGAGVLLMLSAIALVQGKQFYESVGPGQDIAVVPLAIPVAVGPGTVGVLLVMGSEQVNVTDQLVGGCALLAAIVSLGVLLFASSAIEKRLGQRGLNVLSKITGLVLTALSAQIVSQGVKGLFLKS